MATKFQMVILFLLIVITIVHGDSKRIRRVPEVQVFGLPKQFLKTTNNAAIERIHLGTRLKVISKEDDRSDVHPVVDTNSMMQVRPRPIIHTRPHRIFPSNSGNVDGVLEIVSIPSDNTSLILKRRQRSIDDRDGTQLDDLEEAEGKIFRPLFVYRQQVAQRHESKRNQNPIYGAYQYRPTIKKQNHAKKNDFKPTRNSN